LICFVFVCVWLQIFANFMAQMQRCFKKQKYESKLAPYKKQVHKIKPLNPSGYYIYHLLRPTKTLNSAHPGYLSAPYGPHSKQLFPP
jgi:hypothetical protein